MSLLLDIVFAVIALTCVGVPIRLKLSRRNRRRCAADLQAYRAGLIRDLEALISEVESGDFTDAHRLDLRVSWYGAGDCTIAYWHKILEGHELERRYGAARTRHFDNAEFTSPKATAVREKLDAWRAARMKKDFERLVEDGLALRTAWSRLQWEGARQRLATELEFDYEGFIWKFTQVVVIEFARLEKAMQEERAAFMAYRILYSDVFHEKPRLFWVNLDGALPDGWDNLVARYFSNPVLEDFDHRNKHPEAGEFRLLAAQVIEEGDIVLAKLILAYCNHQKFPRVRKELGDVQTAELAKFVNAYNQQHALT